MAGLGGAGCLRGNRSTEEELKDLRGVPHEYSAEKGSEHMCAKTPQGWEGKKPCERLRKHCCFHWPD